MINKIIGEVDSFNDMVWRFENISPTFPNVYKELRGGEFYVSSMVEFVYNGVKYKRHHIESGILNDFTTEEMVIQRLNHAALLCQQKAVPMWKDEVVGVIPSENKGKTIDQILNEMNERIGKTAPTQETFYVTDRVAKKAMEEWARLKLRETDYPLYPMGMK
jgi:hypothetical protein